MRPGNSLGMVHKSSLFRYTIKIIAILSNAILQAFWAPLAHAQIPPCPVGGILPCFGGGGAQGLNMYIMEKIVPAAEVIFIVFAVMALFNASTGMVFNASDDNSLTASKITYYHVIIGSAIVGIAHLVVESFSPPIVRDAIVNPNPVASGIGNVIFYFKLVLSIALTSNLVIQAFRLIVSQSEDQTGKARKRILVGFIGVGVMLMADAIVRAVNPEVGANSLLLAVELRGIANYLLVIFGVVAVASIVVAGLMLVFSIEEGLKDKAKAVIRTTLICLAVVLAAYVIVMTALLV